MNRLNRKHRKAMKLVLKHKEVADAEVKVLAKEVRGYRALRIRSREPDPINVAVRCDVFRVELKRVTYACTVNPRIFLEMTIESMKEMVRQQLAELEPGIVTAVIEGVRSKRRIYSMPESYDSWKDAQGMDTAIDREA